MKYFIKNEQKDTQSVHYLHVYSTEKNVKHTKQTISSPNKIEQMHHKTLYNIFHSNRQFSRVITIFPQL